MDTSTKVPLGLSVTRVCADVDACRIVMSTAETCDCVFRPWALRERGFPDQF